MFLLFETVPAIFTTLIASDAQTTSNSLIPIEWHMNTANEDVQKGELRTVFSLLFPMKKMNLLSVTGW